MVITPTMFSFVRWANCVPNPSVTSWKSVAPDWRNRYTIVFQWSLVENSWIMIKSMILWVVILAARHHFVMVAIRKQHKWQKEAGLMFACRNTLNNFFQLERVFWHVSWIDFHDYRMLLCMIILDSIYIQDPTLTILVSEIVSIRYPCLVDLPGKTCMLNPCKHTNIRRNMENSAIQNLARNCLQHGKFLTAIKNLSDQKFSSG